MPNDKWVPIAEVLEVLNSKEWTWAANQRCKYLNLRVDMRDGHCLIKDRHNQTITLEELKHQYDGNN